MPLYFSVPLLSAALLEGAVLLEGAGLIEDLRYFTYRILSISTAPRKFFPQLSLQRHRSSSNPKPIPFCSRGFELQESTPHRYVLISGWRDIGAQSWASGCRTNRENTVYGGFSKQNEPIAIYFEEKNKNSIDLRNKTKAYQKKIFNYDKMLCFYANFELL